MSILPFHLFPKEFRCNRRRFHLRFADLPASFPAEQNYRANSIALADDRLHDLSIILIISVPENPDKLLFTFPRQNRFPVIDRILQLPVQGFAEQILLGDSRDRDDLIPVTDAHATTETCCDRINILLRKCRKLSDW